jgi:hypothetical protein
LHETLQSKFLASVILASWFVLLELVEEEKINILQYHKNVYSTKYTQAVKQNITEELRPKVSNKMV